MTEDDHAVATRAIDTLDQFMDLLAAHDDLKYRGPEVVGIMTNLLSQILSASATGLDLDAITQEDE